MRAALLVLALTAACGTTVPLAQQGAFDPGLGGPGASTQPSTTSALPSAGTVGGPTSLPGELPGEPGQSAPAPKPSTGGVLPTAVAVDRRPLALGMMYTNNDAAPNAGVDNGNTFTQRRAFEGLVRAWNSRGGLAGRRILPTYVELRSSSANLAEDLQKACTTFTQDKHVSVVLSATGTFSDAFSRCMSQAGTPVLAGDYALGDTSSLAAAPSYFAPATLSTDRRVRGLLDRYVTPTDKLGVVVESCSYNVRTFERTLLPEARRQGLTVTDHVETRCFQGINDLAGQASDMQGAVLRFVSRHVNKVVFLSGGNEGNLMLLFGTAAEGQNYHPHYALTSAVAAVIQQDNTPHAQLANAVGLGWLPGIDSTQPTTTSATKRCAADLKKGAGVTPASGTDRYFAESTCDLFSLYDKVLRSTRGATDAGAVRAAMRALERAFVGAAMVDGATDFSNRPDGPSRGRTFAWVASCSCFGYTGASFSLS
ncbi:MAG: hypothetical protein ABR549_10585 [Mycobacteriales bacterium]